MSFAGAPEKDPELMVLLKSFPACGKIAPVEST